MSTQRPVDRAEQRDPRLEAWLAEGTTVGPEGVLMAAFAASRATRQEPTGWRRFLPARLLRGGHGTRLGAIGVLVAAGMAVALAAADRSPAPAPEPAPPAGPARNGLIAYGLGGDIWVRDPDGGNPRALITGPASDLDPLWSPDGTHLVFQRREAAQPTRLMLADRNGDHQVRLADVKGTDGDWTATAWSPDSRWVAVRWAVHGAPTITIFDTTGAELSHDVPTQGLQPDGWLAWLPPDGAQLVFQAFSDNGSGDRGLYAVAPRGGGWHAVVTSTDVACPYCPYQDPALSPDGRSIAFWSWEERDGQSESWLHVLDLPTGADRVFAPDADYPGLGTAPLFSPDGRSLLWESGPHDAAGKAVLAGGTSVGQLDIAPLDGSAPARPLGTWYVDQQVSTFSPDGTTVLQDRGPGGTYLIDLTDGTATATEQALAAPTWQRLAP